MTTETREQKERRWRYFPCENCGKTIDTAFRMNWRGVGSPHVPAYAHEICERGDLDEYVGTLKQRIYEAEAVLWAKWRIEAVGDNSLDPEHDQRQYERTWAVWKARIEGEG